MQTVRVLTMRYDLPPADVLKKMNPQNIRMYLISRGWIVSSEEQHFDIMENPKTGDTVIVPNDRELRDYVYRIEDIIDSLSEINEESPQSIVSGMMMSSSTDIISYHYEPNNGEVGLIPIPALEKILRVGNNLNFYAYHDMCDFKLRYNSTKWEKKKDLEDIRVGPTIPGSYVVQFIYPAFSDSTYRQSTLEGDVHLDKEVFRQLCDRIELSLSEVVMAAERSKDTLDSELNISYNFVSSLSELYFDNADMEVRRNKMVGSPEISSKPLSLTRKVMRNISHIEQNMRPLESERESTLIGRLVQVTDLRDEVGDEPISMKIKYIDDKEDKIRTATFVVSGEEANLAYDASKNRKTVSLTGIITGPSRSKRLENITEFKILE